MMKMSGVKVIGWAVLAWLTVFEACCAQSDKVGRWDPVGELSDSVTGSVFFSKKRITFENGEFFDIKYVRKIPNFIHDIGPIKDADLYQVTDPHIVHLLFGNTLCGKKIVSYLLVWKPAILGSEKNPRTITMIAGDSPPKVDPDSSECASYEFDLE